MSIPKFIKVTVRYGNMFESKIINVSRITAVSSSSSGGCCLEFANDGITIKESFEEIERILFEKKEMK